MCEWRIFYNPPLTFCKNRRSGGYSEHGWSSYFESRHGDEGGKALGSPLHFSLSVRRFCRMLTIQSATHYSGLSECFTMHINFLRAFEIKFPTKNRKIYTIFSSSTELQKLEFCWKLLFQKPAENFLYIAHVRCEYLKYVMNVEYLLKRKLL